MDSVDPAGAQRRRAGRPDLRPGRGPPSPVAGEPAVARPETADAEVPVTDHLVLALRGRPLPATDRRVLGAFAAYAAAALEQERLAAAAEAARPIAEADRMRTALLAAVSHDLRTPLASAKAAVTSLRATDVAVGGRGSRRAAGHRRRVAGPAGPPGRQPARHEQAPGRARWPCSRGRSDLAEIVARSLDDLGPAGRTVDVDIPDDLPEVAVDPGILERVIANLIANALRYSPAGVPPVLTRQRAARPGGAAGHRPRSGHPRAGLDPDVRPVPAAGRHRQHHRRRPRAGPVPRADRGAWAARWSPTRRRAAA